MDEENDDPRYIDPEILKKELVISLPILSDSDIQRILNGEVSSTEDSSSSSFDDGEKEKFCPKRDQRRLNLLNDANYGIILSFMETFRTHINLKNYPLRIFEDNLLSEHERLSLRYIDFHLTLLKKISSGKTIERDQFVSSMTKFAYRFNRDDGDHLEEFGYSKARIETKLRILRNLFEKQFDRNQPLKNAVANKSSLELCAKPFGRDRLGGLYWLFLDTDGFIRLFREDIDPNRTWINLAKNPQELENLLKILISDYRMRKKFSDWKFSYESFNCLSSSNVFEERYSSNLVEIKKKNDISAGEHSPSSIRIGSAFIKTEHIDLDPIVNLDRDLPASPPLPSPMRKKSKIINLLDLTSDQESINSVEINGNRLSISSSSMDTRDSIYSTGCPQEVNTSLHRKKADVAMAIKTINERHSVIDDTSVVILKPSLEQGIKRKLVDYDDSESEMEASEKNDESSQDSHRTPAKQETKNNADLPIALRRPRRSRRTCVTELSPDSSSTSKSLSQSSTLKKFVNQRRKRSNPSYKTNGRGQRSRRRGRGRTSMSEFSSTTSDDRQPTDDDEDDDLSKDYFPGNTELDNLLNRDLEEEDDDDDDYVPRRTAKTVAQCYEKSQLPSKPCSTCTQTDRPELLLLCEDCDDAYHLECVTPQLLSIPNDEWYCPLCEHKSLCDGLVAKLRILFKDQEAFEIKRKLTVSKRRKRLTNVAVNVERSVKQPVNKRQINIIISSDDDDVSKNANNKNDKEASEKKTNSTNDDDDDDDDDSVYGRKNDENRKPKDEDKETTTTTTTTTGKRRVRSCRKKAKTYCLDDYDKKLQDALVNAGVSKKLVEDDSDNSDDMILKRKSSKKRARYERDEDFDASDGKNDADFVPSRSRTINDDSRSDARDHDDYNDDYNDVGMSEDDSAWRNRRQSSASSISKKKLPPPKSNHTNFQISPMISDEDTILYTEPISDSPPMATVKSEPSDEIPKNLFDTSATGQNVFSTTEVGPNLFDKNKFGRNVFGISEIGQNITDKTDISKTKAGNDTKKRRQRRAAPKKKKSLIQQENISDEEEAGAPPAPKHRPPKKPRDSNDSSLDDDDDYEKLVHKRRLFHQGRTIVRKSITSHIKKLVGDEDDEEEEEEEEGDGEGKNEPKTTDDKTPDETKKDSNNHPKPAKKTSEYIELRLSDDDEFPDDQEILKSTGLINLKRPLTAPQAATFRVPFMPTIQSYQYTMVDPTAHFDFTCQPETPLTQPSDSSQANGDTNLSTTT